MLPDDKFIRMRTTRTSAVVKAFLEKYPDAVAQLITGHLHMELTSPMDEWCTKKSLATLNNFFLIQDDSDILWFHEDSRELGAPLDQLNFVDELASKKMVRFRVLTHIISMRTARTSAVVKAFIEKYPNAVVKLNGKIATRPMDEWCTKKSLASLIDFSLSLDGKDILRFHDDSRELWAPFNQSYFVDELKLKWMVRYEVLSYGEPKSRKPNFFGRFFSKKA